MREHLKEVRESAGAATALAGLFGAIVYTLVTFVCSLIYTPLGVSPSDVGLSYGALLIRTAVGVGGIAVLYMTTAVLALVLAHAVWKVGLDPSSDPRVPGGFGRPALAVLLVIIAVAGPIVPSALVGRLDLGIVGAVTFLSALFLIPVSRVAWKDQRRRALALLMMVVGVGAAGVLGLVVGGAAHAAKAFGEGRRPSAFLGVPPPWGAQIVRVSWAAQPAPDLPLPRCLLYLGEANGMSVFYDARANQERALRVPTSAVLIEVLPNTRSSLPAEDRPGSCS